MEYTKEELIKSLIGEQDTESTSTSGIAGLLSKLLTSRNQVHIYHLQTKSYAAHKAMCDYYNGISELIDGLVESYQGKYGIITGYDCEGVNDFKSDSQVITYLSSLAKSVENSRKTIKDSYLQNQIDTIVELIYSTLYKLKNLS